MLGNIQHNAPAGQKYSSIRDAGEQTLATYCRRFPQSPDRESFILPILFKSAHPENVKQADGSLSEADKKLLTGLNINIRGEQGEYEVYKVFYTLVRQSPTESVLVIHGYGLDNDNGRNLKKHAIMKELPEIDLSGVRMKMEHDFLTIIRYIGIVLCEVKTSASPKNIESAESQLHNSDTFVKQIFTAIAGQTAPKLPTVKVIIVPKESSTPSAPKRHNDCHLIYQDDLQNFTPTWTQIVDELKNTAQSCFISPTSFEHLVQFLVGVWTMKCMTKNKYDFDNDDASLSTDLIAIDTAVNRAEYASTKQAQKLTTDIATSMNEIFRKVNELNIMYLSPQQKSLYDNYKHALIHSHAGTGKTMLFIFKIIDILEADPTQKVLLVASHPHHLRLQKILNKHNITTDIITNFPYVKSSSIGSRIKRIFKHQTPTPPPACDVLIITLQDFFEGLPETTRGPYMEYDVSMFNIFMDDMHSYRARYSSICTFTDIGNFIDHTYKLLSSTDQYAWFAFDLAQQGEHTAYPNERSDQLFLTSKGSPRTFSIPVVTMTKVLRNTKEITDVLDSARREQMKFHELDTKHLITDISCGHHITTGTRVLCEKLCGRFQRKTEIEHFIHFVCDRVCALLRNLSSTTSQQPNKFPYATVAILFNFDEDLQKYKPALQSMIRQHFNIGVQSIEEQLLSNNNDDVIIDHGGNVQSFESPTVVYVKSYNDERVLYNALSRARTQCVVVDVDIDSDPLPLQNVDIVAWKEENGTFQNVHIERH